MRQSNLSRLCDGVMESAWIAALIFAPLFFNVFSSRIFEPDKITIVRSLAILILAAWFVKIVDQGGVSWQHLKSESSFLRTIWRMPLLAPAAITAIIYVIATIFSVTPRASLFGSYQRLQGTYTFLSYFVIFLAMIVNMRGRVQIERVVTTIILVSLPVSLYGILQHYKIDPIPWGADTSIRVASTLGNSIFVAAYLIMVIPLTIYRIVEVFRVIMQEKEPSLLHILRSTIYIVVLILQVVTIYFSGSRGPMLGLLAGGYFMALLLPLIWGKRWLTRLFLAGALLGVVLLSLLNVPNGPLESIRKSPAIGRFGQLLDTESNTAKVRYYIWQGASQLVAPHEPIEFPDGTKDRFNFLRPLIGYGPESMYVAFNPFYVPELGHVERRNASPDRAHNETWDSLITTGLFGFIAYLALFLLVFYYGLSWLGMVAGEKRKILYWSLALAGGLVGSILVIVWGGIPYLGVGLPFGIMVGLIIYIAVVALTSHISKPAAPAEYTRAILLIALLAAIMAHWLEINFGIAILSTRLYFWVDVALLLIVGYILPKMSRYDEAAQAAQETTAPLPAVQAPKAARQSKRQKTTQRAKQNQADLSGSYPALASGMILGLVLVILSYSFFTNSSRATNIFEIIFNGLTRLPNQNDAQSLGVLLMFKITWLVGVFVLASEIPHQPDRRTLLRSLVTIAAASFIVWAVYVVWHAGLLSSLAQTSVRSQEELIGQVQKLGGLLTFLYFYTLLLVLGIAFLLVTKAAREKSTSRASVILAPIMLVFVMFVSYITNLQVVHADITFKMAEPFTEGTSWPIAAFMYNRSIDLSPNEDYYYLFLGRAYLEQAKLVTNEQEQSALAAQTDKDLKNAQRLNPLNTDHTANLARLYNWWAGTTADASLRGQRAQIASHYYERAVALSRNSAALWGEWGLLYLQVFNQPAEAFPRLEKALSLDSTYPLGLALMGEYYTQIAEGQSDAAKKIEYLETAADYFDRAVNASVGRDAAGKVGYLTALGNVYLGLAKIDENAVDRQKLQRAAETFVKALESNPPEKDRYRLEELAGKLYYELGDLERAKSYLESALAHAPETERLRINQLLQQVIAAP